MFSSDDTRTEYNEQVFEKLDLSKKTVGPKEFYDCTFLDCNFSEIVFRNCRFNDCKFKNW